MSTHQSCTIEVFRLENYRNIATLGSVYITTSDTIFILKMAMEKYQNDIYIPRVTMVMPTKTEFQEGKQMRKTEECPGKGGPCSGLHNIQIHIICIHVDIHTTKYGNIKLSYK